VLIIYAQNGLPVPGLGVLMRGLQAHCICSLLAVCACFEWCSSGGALCLVEGFQLLASYCSSGQCRGWLSSMGGSIGASVRGADGSGGGIFGDKSVDFWLSRKLVIIVLKV
jgi:hypothetical protein